MKKYLLLIAFALLLTSCNFDERNKQLKNERQKLETQVQKLEKKCKTMNDYYTMMCEKSETIKEEYDIYNSDKKPKYFIAIKIYQTTFSLDIGEHIKNNMNSFIIWIETSEQFYKSVSIGKEIDNNFKSGSFWIDGDISKLHIKVINKKIK